MKKLLLFLSVLFLWTQSSFGQLTGPKTIPGDYATIAAAITDLNTVGVGAGGVTFNVAAGFTETITAPLSITATGTSGNPIIFQKSGAGANPLITAYTTGTGTPGTAIQDGLWNLVGSDYVTIDGIDLTDPNATNPATMEYGYGLFKASDVDGCQYNTIKNCVVTLNRLNFVSGVSPAVDGSRAINVMNALVTTQTTVLVPTLASGTNSYNMFYTNTLQNCNIGIAIIGYAGATPFTLCDFGNDIGGSSPATGNNIINYGGGTSATNPAAGVRTLAQYNLNVSYNTVNNNNGSGVNHVSTLRGIYLNTAVSASATISHNTLSISSGATTSQVSVIENVSGATAAGNTINITNNTYSAAYLTATSGIVYGIYSTASAATVNINYNSCTGINYSGAALTGTGVIYPIYNSGSATTLSVSNNTIDAITRTGTTGGNTIGIYASSGTTQTVNNNTVSNISLAGAGTAGFIYGIQVAGITVTANNNTIYLLTNTKTTGTSALYGLYDVASPTNENFNNNIIHDLTHNGTGTVYGMFMNTVAGNRNVYGNQIYTISGAGTTIVGLTQTTSSPNIYKNKIYNIQSTSTGAPTVTGILLTSVGTAGTSNIYNNLIGDLKAPSASSTDAIRGIGITATTTSSTHNVYYNTIYLNASSTGTNFGSTGIYHTASATATTAVLNLRNNVIINNSTPAGTGLTVAYRRSSGIAGMLANYASTSNNNDFYAGTPGASNLIYSDGTGTAQTIEAYKAGVFTAGTIAPRDASSFTENPTFVSTTGSNSDFLHINTGVATQIESAGVAIAGITDDFDGDVRNVTTPDIGADEFTGIGIDLTGPSINYTTLGNGIVAANRSFTGVAITDASGVNGTAGTRPRVYYKKSTDGNVLNDNSNATDGWKYAEAAEATSPFSFTINYSLLNGGAGVIATDIIQYFVVAQDLAGTPNISINSGTFAAAPTSVALTGAAFPLTGTINQYSVVGTISGTKTVGTAGDYPTLTGAGGLFAAINGAVVNGNITATIISDITTEDGTNALNQWAEEPASSNFTVTIQPDAATLRTISGTYTGGLIRLNGADRVTIDGNFSGAGKYLTFSNLSVTSPSATMMLSSTGSSSGASNNTIKNCNIQAGVKTSGFYGIAIGGATVASTGADNDNNTIQDNNLSKAYIGIWAQGSASSNPGLMDNLTISGNSIGSITSGSEIGLNGLVLSNTTGCTVSNNEIFGITNTSSFDAVSILTGVFSSSFSKNKVYNIINNGTNRATAFGIGSSTSANLTFDNNLIYGVINNGTGGNTFGGYGFYVSAGSTYNFYYNSVFLSGDRDAVATTKPTTISSCIFIASGISSLVLQDNIFENTQTAATSAPKSYSIYSSSANTAFTTINYNEYFVSGLQGILGFIVSDRTDLAGIVTGFGQNANSISSDPQFLTTTDLQVFVGSPVLAAGTPIGGITTDYAGASRSGTTPSMGAYESGISSAAVDWANLQSPATAIITEGDTFIVHAQVLETGITDAVGQGAGIESWFGWNSTDTDPSTWTNWIAGTYNADSGNNDDYIATMGAGILSGTYYYASRFRITGGTYQYGGYNVGGGGFWDGSTNVSGVLTVNPYTVTLPYSQGFEDVTFPPAGWARESVIGSEVWARSTAAFNSGVASAKITFQLTGGEDWLITPKVMGIVTDDQLSFWWVNAFGTAYPPDNLDILVSTTDNALASFTNTLGTIVTSSAPAEWTQHIYSLSAFAGQNIYIAFKHTNTDGNGGYLDDIELSNSISTWLGTIDSDWTNAGNWSTGVPTSAVNATIGVSANDPVLSTAATVQNLTINMGAALTIANTGQLTVITTLFNAAGINGLVINSDATGTGSLLHNTAGVDAKIERYLTGNTTILNTFDYHLVSIPLNADITASQFLGMYLYEFNAIAQDYLSLGSSTETLLDNNQGFMVFYPNTNTTINFTGQLNNGAFTAVTSTDAVDEFSLVPNPYPSAIDWDAASGWTKTNLQDYFYIWNPVNNNYVSWNAGAGTALTGEIPVGQSFFVKANAASPVLTMTNAVRVHSTQAFWKETKEIVPEVFHLRVSDNESADEILVRLSNLADNSRGFMDIDKLYGAETAPQLYSLSGNAEKLTTNALNHSTQTISIPVGLEYYQEGQLTFNANGFESFESSVSIFLEDKLLNKMIDLKATPSYTFTYNTGEDELRFNLLLYGVNATPEIVAKDYQIWSTVDHINIHIPSLTGQKAVVELYDLLGHLVLSQQVNLGLPTEVNAPQFNGMGIVHVIANNKVYSEKVFIR
ncbi:MAG: hypothetical protein HOO86_09770 [Bacteroidales bacterium]|nr:hypothetical protein [Bacteroidales bacterium]